MAKKTKLLFFGREMAANFDIDSYSLTNDDESIRAVVETEDGDEWAGRFDINTMSMVVEGGTDLYETKEAAAKALEGTLTDLAAGIAWLRAGK